MITLPEGLGPIRRIGLTGSMGTGKSTAAGYFRSMGVPVVDADELARRVVLPGRPALRELCATFGEEILDGEGKLDRRKLAGLVFDDPAGRKRLEEILHPLIQLEAEAEMVRLMGSNPSGLVVYDIPLLFETGAEGKFDLVVTVYAPREAQVARAAARSEISAAEVENRLAAQMDVAEKARRSHVALNNSATREELSSQVAALLEAIRRHNKALSAGLT